MDIASYVHMASDPHLSLLSSIDLTSYAIEVKGMRPRVEISERGAAPACAITGLMILYCGILDLRGHQLKKGTYTYNYMLGRVNSLRTKLGKPRTNSLSPEDYRLHGWIDVVIGSIMLIFALCIFLASV